jgi:hypothetical protein
MEVQESGTQLQQDVTRSNKRSRVVSFPSKRIMHDSVGEGPLSALEGDAACELIAFDQLDLRMEVESLCRVLPRAQLSTTELLRLTIKRFRVPKELQRHLLYQSGLVLIRCKDDLCGLTLVHRVKETVPVGTAKLVATPT